MVSLKLCIIYTYFRATYVITETVENCIITRKESYNFLQAKAPTNLRVLAVRRADERVAAIPGFCAFREKVHTVCRSSTAKRRKL
ncbi:hypothetical protein SADUNF_Sadunf11G0051900 [Salix dunnii]|uniref:Uncharacterized protein n=1 Tax=Salix dunnii TaxID=1413687 RepID=A0A835MT59_9ROSI|nr:hypothetical protein SADUNF_Sadunf11G0051900 [Salix dunnii]